MTKKRRARAGETPAYRFDVIVYAPENWLHRNRVTVRDKDTGRVVEERGYVVSWAIGRATRKLILAKQETGIYLDVMARDAVAEHQRGDTLLLEIPEPVVYHGDIA